MRYLPIQLDIAGRRVLVIGGGRVASRKIKALRDCGALVTVVSPAFCSGVARLKGITRVRRGYRRSDLCGVALAVSAAGPAEVNRRAYRDALAAGLPINVVDQPELCTFIMPAILRRGDLTITVSTGGGSPALAKRIRDLLAEMVGPEFGEHVALLRQMRALVRRAPLSLDQRGQLLRAMAEDGVRERLRRDGIKATRAYLRGLLDAASGAGGRSERGLPLPLPLRQWGE